MVSPADLAENYMELQISDSEIEANEAGKGRK
jgi:hypothetical protein